MSTRLSGFLLLGMWPLLDWKDLAFIMYLIVHTFAHSANNFEHGESVLNCVGSREAVEDEGENPRPLFNLYSNEGVVALKRQLIPGNTDDTWAWFMELEWHPLNPGQGNCRTTELVSSINRRKGARVQQGIWWVNRLKTWVTCSVWTLDGDNWTFEH